ncbi:MAG: pyridoxal phosphate-dependent aminotransferase, partial [Thermodesulfobacteriota bacterium]
AAYLSKQQGTRITSSEVMMSCGAAGGLNSLFRAVLEPGDEVLCPAPYFVEYGFYTANYGGVFRPVPGIPLQFGLDLEAIEEKISPRTRVVLINSPNNPTGYIYSSEELQKLVEIIQRANKKTDKPILLVSDEPYRFLTYEGHAVPSLLPLYQNSIVVSSFSKSHSLAGERIGYVLLNPELEDKDKLMQGIVFTNRILGYVNAPAIGQQVLHYALNAGVDTGTYERRRKLMCDILSSAGYNYHPPRGGFYIFPEAPGGDDVEFVNRLQDELVLAVPGSGFGFAGHFRLSFCVPEKVIQNSAKGFEKAMQKFKTL